MAPIILVNVSAPFSASNNLVPLIFVNDLDSFNVFSNLAFKDMAPLGNVNSLATTMIQHFPQQTMNSTPLTGDNDLAPLIAVHDFALLIIIHDLVPLNGVKDSALLNLVHDLALLNVIRDWVPLTAIHDLASLTAVYDSMLLMILLQSILFII